MNINFVTKRTDEDFVIYSDEFPFGYNVVPKSVDPSTAIDIDEVKAWCLEYPDKVMDEESVENIPQNIQEWLSDKAKIEEDLEFLKSTDDVGYQLARHERGTQVLSDEKYYQCMQLDTQRGTIAAGLKARKNILNEALASLKSQYPEPLLKLWKVTEGV